MVLGAGPRKPRGRGRDWLRGALLFLVIGGGIPAVQGFREDEVECEETADYLAECCPGFDPGTIGCTFSRGCTSQTRPVLSPSESRCIRDKSCTELVDEGICERVLARGDGIHVDTYSYDDTYGYEDDPADYREVCR